MEINEEIVYEFADFLANKISNKVERKLKKLKEGCMQSADDSGLINLWEEICVQMQFEEYFCWDLYEKLIEDYIESQVDLLLPYEKTALWLQTEKGINWEIENEGKDGSFTYIVNDIVKYIAEKYIYSKAREYSNVRIRRYLDVSYSYE